jgi:uncharacterized membrane-anchored protein
VKNSHELFLSRKSYLVSYSLMLGGFLWVMFSAFVLNVLILVYIGLVVGVMGFAHYVYVFKHKLDEKPPKTKNPWES